MLNEKVYLNITNNYQIIKKILFCRVFNLNLYQFKNFLKLFFVYQYISKIILEPVKHLTYLNQHIQGKGTIHLQMEEKLLVYFHSNKNVQVQQPLIIKVCWTKSSDNSYNSSKTKLKIYFVLQRCFYFLLFKV